MITHKTLFLELIVLIYWCYISAGVTIYPSETIDIIEGGEYTFGLEEDNKTNFCNCAYKSNLDNSWTTFPVSKSYNACVKVNATTPKPKITVLNKIFQQRASENNIIKDYGKIQWCKINVAKVNDQGPSEWSLKPDDWNKTFTEQVNFKINFFYAVPILTTEISIFEGEDFFQYLNTSLTFESCSFTFNGTTKSLNLKAEEAVALKTDSEVDQKQPERIYSLGRGLCGFRLKNASLADKFDWTLTGVTNDKKKYRAVFKPYISPNIPDSILHKEEVIKVGDYKLITCKSKSSGEVETVNFCKVYNPKGDLVLTQDKLSNRDCSYTINTFQVDNYGVWKCFTGNTYSMKSVLYTFKFIEKESPSMLTWVKEKEDYLSIGCQLRNSEIMGGFKYCKMTTPDQQFFSLTPGSATERYLALGTDLKNFKCDMEIKLPLRDNEIGMWRCETDKGGAFINVSSPAIVDYKKYSKITTRLEKNVLILCEVPYYSSFCHIKSPNGTRYIPKEKEEPWLGRCSLEIKTVVSDNGTWTCSFAQTGGMPDEEIAVEVTIADVMSYDPEVKATEDYSVSMLCNSGGLPLQYCQFIDPNGKSYYIDNKVNSSYLSYYGKGIEYGECGIKIAKVAKSDAGTWSCVIQIIKEKNEISARISVEVSPNLLSGSNLVLGLGLTVGIVAISSLFIIIGFRTIKQRRRGRLEIARTQSLNDIIQNDDQEDIFNIGGPPRSYDNPQTVRDDNHEHQY